MSFDLAGTMLFDRQRFAQAAPANRRRRWLAMQLPHEVVNASFCASVLAQKTTADEVDQAVQIIQTRRAIICPHGGESLAHFRVHSSFAVIGLKNPRFSREKRISAPLFFRAYRVLE